MADIFGQSSGEIRNAILREQLGQAQIIGLSGSAGRGAVVGGILGRALQGEDPRLRQARALEEINEELTGRGLEPGKPGFRQALVPMVRQRVGLQAAMQANQMALQAEQQEMALQALQQGPGASSRTLQRLGFTAEEAADIASDPELSRKVINARLKPREKTILVRNLSAAGVDLSTAQGKSTMLEILKKPGVSVQLSDKVKQAVQIQEAKAEAAQGREAATVANASARLRELGQRFTSGGLLERGGAALSPGDRRRWNVARRRLAKGVAQMRNPGDAEAASIAEEALVQALPTPEQLAAFPAILDEVLSEIEIEAGQEGGRPSPLGARKSISDLTPGDLERLSDEELEALAR